MNVGKVTDEVFLQGLNTKLAKHAHYTSRKVGKMKCALCCLYLLLFFELSSFFSFKWVRSLIAVWLSVTQVCFRLWFQQLSDILWTNIKQNSTLINLKTHDGCNFHLNPEQYVQGIFLQHSLIKYFFHNFLLSPRSKTTRFSANFDVKNQGCLLLMRHCVAIVTWEQQRADYTVQ